MADLSNTERELVALGAAIASNCVPCAEVHIAEAKKFGLTDLQLVEAVRMADKVRQVPAQKVLRVALALLNETHDATRAGSGGSPDKLASASQASTLAAARGCGRPHEDGGPPCRTTATNDPRRTARVTVVLPRRRRVSIRPPRFEHTAAQALLG